MALSNDERRHLQELADQISADDPALARHLTVPGQAAAARRRHRWTLVSLVVLSAAIITAAIAMIIWVPFLIVTALAAVAAALVGIAASWRPRRSR